MVSVITLTMNALNRYQTGICFFPWLEVYSQVGQYGNDAIKPVQEKFSKFILSIVI